MASSHAARARLTAGLAGIAVAALCVALLVDAAAGPLGGLVEVLAWCGLAAAVTGVVAAVPALGTVAAVLIGASFCATRFEEPGTLDARAVPLAAVLLLLAELVAWSAEARTAAPPGVPTGPRALVLVATVVAGGGATALVAAVVAAPVGDDLGLAAVGAGGLALVAVLAVGLARRAAPGAAGPAREPVLGAALRGGGRWPRS